MCYIFLDHSGTLPVNIFKSTLYMVHDLNHEPTCKVFRIYDDYPNQFLREKTELCLKIIFTMALIKPVRGFTPVFGKNCYLAENCTIIGDVVMGDGNNSGK